MPKARRPPPRKTYHHGDLRASLIEAGLALAREGGPQAVVLREATRRAGVAPNAAYRHFANHQALFDAVRASALGALALAIEQEMRQAEALPDAPERARALLAAVGRGYLGFAQSETGWFRAAFASGPFDVELPPDPARTGDKGLNPFELLAHALDALVQAGVLPPERRLGAEFLAWSAVHGMALLVIDGPLRRAPQAMRAALGQRLLHMVETGL
ncbi:TetR/AcrR family transcriptional regulator [Xenophilus arseniciresistens]|uniref:TetR/AcrR family transcriptional regulator n=1 Tax=Xenophilus arseniciresistens TaxID=1283306 RepID=A0AAE3NBV4_9BURK|nr:TetR/AcrR family transcriptional regulator [Xenophilus arseniciresistens]MDA7418333.1 TetR/AcrR family transcriptional regulator [Xenophilus arseniciresistens]